MANNIPPNVHGIGEYSSLADEQLRGQNRQIPANAQSSQIPFISQQQEQFNGDPRKENFFRMLKLTFCPKVRFITLTMLVVVTCIIMFIVCESVFGLPPVNCCGSVDGISQRQLLQTSREGMIKMGAVSQGMLEKGEIYRLVSAIFLHWDFMHIFFNMISLLSIMSFLEISYGPVITLVLFIFTGIGGNIFSACVSSWNPEQLAAGASTSIFGLVGCWVAFMILNWRALGTMMGEEMRCMMMCMVSSNSFLIFILSSYGQTGIESTYMRVDTAGHFGGFLTGLLGGLFIPKELQPSSYTKGCKMIGIAMTSLFFLLNFVLFYTVKVVDG